MLIVSSDLEKTTKLIDLYIADRAIKRVKKRRSYLDYCEGKLLKRPQLIKTRTEIKMVMICYDPLDANDVKAARDLEDYINGDTGNTTVSAPATTGKRKRRTKTEMEAAKAASKNPATNAPTTPQPTEDDVIAVCAKAAEIAGGDSVRKILKYKKVADIAMKHYPSIIEQLKALIVQPDDSDDSDDSDDDSW